MIKQFHVLLWGLAALSVGLSGSAQGVVFPGRPVNSSHGARIPGVLIVNFEPDVRPQAKSSQSGVTGLVSVDILGSIYNFNSYRELFPGSDPMKAPQGAPDLTGFYVFELDPTLDLDQAAADLLADPNVRAVEYDFYAYILREPNDPTFPLMSNLKNGLDRDIDAPEAWDRGVGTPTVVLADTDTGVLYEHPDLIDNIWVNPGEDLDGDGVVFDADDINGIDDDGNGYVDDLIGWDFVSSGSAVWPGEDGSVADHDPKDFNGHGTHTSGTFAAVTNNGIGVSGIAGGFGGGEPGCKIMCLRMGYSFDDGGSENGRTHMSYVANAFRYAADNGAVAINYSFGSSDGGGIEAATDYAIAAGLIISASAGNDGNSSFGYLQSREDVLCVASTTSSDTKSGFSNIGVEVDVSAPGSSIRSTVSNHYSPSYAAYSGTSMAAPHVVGLVGLMKSLNPLLTREEMIDRIINTADNIDALNPTYAGLLGSGRVNAFNAVDNIASVDFDATPRVGPAPLEVDFADLSLTAATAWTWDFGDGDSAAAQHPTHTFAPGMYDVSLRISTDVGDGLKVRTDFVAALAETLRVADVESDAGVPVAVEVRLTNNLPVSKILLPINATHVSPTATARMDSIRTTGCRTEGFGLQQNVFNNMLFGQVAMLMRADGAPELPPGDGPIAKIWFRINAGANSGEPVVITTDPVGDGVYELELTSAGFTYAAESYGGSLTPPLLIGDFNFDGIHNVFDVVALIDVVFRSGALPDPPAIADTTCDGMYNVFDVIRLIDTAYRAIPPPTCP